jgi:hypothetical protein
MNISERHLLETLDNMVLSASGDELKKIQEIDLKTQMDGLSFYDVFANFKSTANHKSLEN